MKKFLSVILALVLILSMAACGKSAKLPDGFDQTLYDYATAAYELVRDYNLGKIDKAAAKERAETISKNVDSLKVPENNTELSDETFKISYEIKQLSIVIDLRSFSYKVVSNSSTVDIEKSLKELIEK